jgi:putative flippase GtrA
VRNAISRLRKSPAVREVTRYLVGGTAITLATHLLYLGGLQLALRPQLSWALAFACGIMMGYVVHRRYVFRAQVRRHHWLTFPASYLLRFALGELLLWAGLAMGITAGWAGFITNVVMAPLGFLLLRLVLKGEARSISRTTHIRL